MTSVDRRHDSLHHVACTFRIVPVAVQWYQSRFRCEITYEDETWALLRFSNSDLALIRGGDHPPHIGIVTETALEVGPMTTHRDGTQSVYITDPSGNAVELLDPASVRTA